MGDIMQTDIQRALLGTIIIELIAIIILLSICIKLDTKRKQPEKKVENFPGLKTTRSRITLPPFTGTDTPGTFKFQRDVFETFSTIDVTALELDGSNLMSEGLSRDVVTRASEDVTSNMTPEGLSRDVDRRKSDDSELSTWSDGQRLTVDTRCSGKHWKTKSWFRSKSLTIRGPEEHTTPKTSGPNNNSLPLGFML